MLGGSARTYGSCPIGRLLGVAIRQVARGTAQRGRRRLESRDSMIPGIVALLLVVTTSPSTMAIGREREVGTLEQLNVTPLARRERIVGKLLPYALIGMFDVVLVTLVAVFLFQVPFLGSFPLLFLCSIIYLLSTLAWACS